MTDAEQTGTSAQMLELVVHLRESATDLCCPTGCCYGETMVKAADVIELLLRTVAGHDARPGTPISDKFDEVACEEPGGCCEWPECGCRRKNLHGTFACPICGEDTPHHHSTEVEKRAECSGCMNPACEDCFDHDPGADAVALADERWIPANHVDGRPTVMLFVPDGYKNADEFLRDCQFERAQPSPGVLTGFDDNTTDWRKIAPELEPIYSDLCTRLQGSHVDETMEYIARVFSQKLVGFNAGGKAREALEPYCQHLQICSSRDPLFNNPCDCGLEAALAAGQDAREASAIRLMAEIDQLDVHGRYGRLAREAIAALAAPQPQAGASEPVGYLLEKAGINNGHYFVSPAEYQHVEERFQNLYRPVYATPSPTAAESLANPSK